MVYESQKRDIATFFFFALLDEALALEASVKAYSSFYNEHRRQVNEVKNLPESERALRNLLDNSKVVHHCFKIWKRFKDKTASKKVHVEAGWLLPQGLELGLWRHFVREADEEKVLAIIWSFILGFSDQDIAKGLGVTVGTIRHRSGHGLRQLGKMKVAN